MKLHRFTNFPLKRVRIRNGIAKNTLITNDHLTPELKIRLLTRNSPFWTLKPDSFLFKDPFWAFYWAGGQALTRFVLDNRHDFEGRLVLDFGSGCGASAIAAAKSKAKACFACDIDNISCEAVSMNARLNNCHVHIIQKNILNEKLPIEFDYILVGDMFYDPDFAEKLFSWLESCKLKGVTVLIGDPGRYALAENYKPKLKLVGEYNLLPIHAEENNGFKTSCVWKL